MASSCSRPGVSCWREFAQQSNDSNIGVEYDRAAQWCRRYRAAVVERARRRTRAPWWLFHGRPSPYPPRVQAIGSLTVIALVAAFVGVAYAAGFTWPWRHAYIAGPLLGWLMYLPMRQWLRAHGYWDDARLRRYEDDE